MAWTEPRCSCGLMDHRRHRSVWPTLRLRFFLRGVHNSSFDPISRRRVEDCRRIHRRERRSIYPTSRTRRWRQLRCAPCLTLIVLSVQTDPMFSGFRCHLRGIADRCCSTGLGFPGSGLSPLQRRRTRIPGLGFMPFLRRVSADSYRLFLSPSHALQKRQNKTVEPTSLDSSVHFQPHSSAPHLIVMQRNEDE